MRFGLTMWMSAALSSVLPVATASPSSAQAPLPADATAAPTTQPEATTPAPASPGDLADKPRLWAVRTIDARYVKPRLLQLSLPGRADDAGHFAVFSGGRPLDIPIPELVRVEITSAGYHKLTGLARMPDNAMAFMLTSGEWVVGLVSGGDARRVAVSVVGVGQVDLPLRDIRGIVSPAGRAEKTLGGLEGFLLTEPRGDAAVRDVVQLANGEVLAGTVIAVGPKGLTVKGDLGEVNVTPEVLRMARLANPLPGPFSRDVPPMLWVDMDNGSRLLVRTLTWQGHTLRVQRVDQKDELLLSDQNVTAMEVVNGRWRWLDQVKPLVDEHRPLMTVHWPTRFGLNVIGGPIRVAGTSYAHGIGVHSFSRLVFETGGATRFQCIAGLDESAGAVGDVDVQVLVDGRVKFEHKATTISNSPLKIDLNITGSEKIELKADYGRGGHVQDRFNWADPILIR